MNKVSENKDINTARQGRYLLWVSFSLLLLSLVGIVLSMISWNSNRGTTSLAVAIVFIITSITYLLGIVINQRGNRTTSFRLVIAGIFLTIFLLNLFFSGGGILLGLICFFFTSAISFAVLSNKQIGQANALCFAGGAIIPLLDIYLPFSRQSIPGTISVYLPLLIIPISVFYLIYSISQFHRFSLQTKIVAVLTFVAMLSSSLIGYINIEFFRNGYINNTLGITRSNYSSFREAQIQVLTQLVIVIAFVVMGTTLGLSRLFTKPLTRIASIINNIGLGQPYTDTKVETEDEIGTIIVALNNMTQQIKSTASELEVRFTKNARSLERRNIQLHAVADVARDATLSQAIDDILSRTAQLIRDRFGVYHTGIFIIDESGEQAILFAAGGEAGQLMIANNLRYKVGDNSIVGNVASTGESRIIHDVGADPDYIKNSLLPYTNSEIALPLRISSRIIGVLNIQSEKVNAFEQEDLISLQAIADQLAVTVEKIHLDEARQRTISETESVFQQYVARTWQAYMQRSKGARGYSYEGTTPVTLDSPPAGSEDTIKKGITTVSKEDHHNILSVPIKLRGQTLGALNLRYADKDISKETIAFVEEAANRLALALENARLVEDAQRLASREKQINIITSRAQQSTDLDIILQNTIRELGNTLGVSKAFIQIGIPASEETPN